MWQNKEYRAKNGKAISEGLKKSKKAKLQIKKLAKIVKKGHKDGKYKHLYEINRKRMKNGGARKIAVKGWKNRENYNTDAYKHRNQNPESKNRISLGQKKRFKEMSQKERKKFSQKRSVTVKKLWRKVPCPFATENRRKSCLGNSRGRVGFYKNLLNKNSEIRMRSSWERRFAFYQDKLKVKWKYEPRQFPFRPNKLKYIFYTPDFYLPETDEWYEIKGYNCEKDKPKIALFRKQFPDKKLIVLKSDWFKKNKLFDIPDPIWE